MPLAFQATTVEFEVEMALQQSLPRIADRLPVAPIPNDHCPAAVFALRNHAFVVEISKRMVLGPHGKPLDGRHETRPLRHRPAHQCSVEFETQIVVQASRGMFLNDKSRAFLDRHRRLWLGRALEVPPLAVAIQSIRLLIRTHGRLA